MLKRVRRLIDFVSFCVGEFWTYGFHGPEDVKSAIKKEHLITRFRKQTGKTAHNDDKIAQKIFEKLPDENKI